MAGDKVCLPIGVAAPGYAAVEGVVCVARKYVPSTGVGGIEELSDFVEVNSLIQ